MDRAFRQGSCVAGVVGLCQGVGHAVALELVESEELGHHGWRIR